MSKSANYKTSNISNTTHIINTTIPLDEERIVGTRRAYFKCCRQSQGPTRGGSRTTSAPVSSSCSTAAVLFTQQRRQLDRGNSSCQRPSGRQQFIRLDDDFCIVWYGIQSFAYLLLLLSHSVVLVSSNIRFIWLTQLHYRSLQRFNIHRLFSLGTEFWDLVLLLFARRYNKQAVSYVDNHMCRKW